MTMKMMMRKRRKKEWEIFLSPSFPVIHPQWKFCEKKKLSNFPPPPFLFSIFDFSKSSMSFSFSSFAPFPPPPPPPHYYYYYLCVNLCKSSTHSSFPFSYFSSFSFSSSSSSFFCARRFSSASSRPSPLPSLSLLSPSSSSSAFSSSFEDIGVHSALCHAFEMQNIWKPTTMQERVIEQMEKGRDVVIAAGTGSGKTLAYLLPLLNRLYCLHDRIEEIQNQQNSVEEEEEIEDFSEEEGREVGRRRGKGRDTFFRKKGMKQKEEGDAATLQYFRTSTSSHPLPSAAVNPEEHLTFSSSVKKSSPSPQFLTSLKIQTSSPSSSSSSSSFLRRPSLASMISNPLVSHRPWIILTPTRDLVSQICQMLQSFDILGRVSIQTLTDIEEFPNLYKSNSSPCLPGSSGSSSYFYPSAAPPSPSSSVSRFQEISVQKHAEPPAIVSSSRIRWGAVDVVITTPQKFVEDLNRFSRERLYPSCIIFDEIDSLWNDGASKTRVMDIIRYLRPRLPKRSSALSSPDDEIVKEKDEKKEYFSYSHHSRQYSFQKDSKSSSSPSLPNLVPCQFVFVGATLPSVGITSPGSMISERFCTARQIFTADFQRVKPEIEQKWLSVTGTSFTKKKSKFGRKRENIKFTSSPFSSSSLTASVGTSCSYFDRRIDLLMMLLKKKSVPRTLVFVNNLVTCKTLFSFLQNAEWPVVAFHRGMTAVQRMRSCEEFFEGKAIVMISTDLGARGIDMKAVHHIINFQFPRDVVTYIHRCGRTARLGSMKNTEDDDVEGEGRGGNKKKEEEEEEKRNDECRQKTSSPSREDNRKMGRGRKGNKSSSNVNKRIINNVGGIREERRQRNISDMRNPLSSEDEGNDFTTTSSFSSVCNNEEKNEEEIRQMFASSAGDFGFVVSNLICPEEDELLVKSVVKLQKEEKLLEEGYSRRRLLRTNAKRRVAVLEKTEENNFWNFFFTDKMEETVNQKNEKEEKKEKIITLDKNVKIKQTCQNLLNLYSSSSSSSSFPPSSSSFPPSSSSSSFPPSSSSSSFPPSSSSSSSSSFPPSSSSSSFPPSSSSSISRRRSDLLLSDSEEEEEALGEFQFFSDRRILKEKFENNDEKKPKILQNHKNISSSPSPFQWDQLRRQDDPKNSSSPPKLIQRFNPRHLKGREEMRNRFLLNNFEEKNDENAEDMKL